MNNKINLINGLKINPINFSKNREFHDKCKVPDKNEFPPARATKDKKR